MPLGILSSLSSLTVLQVSYGYTSTCFKGVKTTPIPSDHVYNRIKKPALIGYKGNIRNYQENTLEGMNDVIHRKFQGIHMQVQITSDEQLILFGDKNLKVLMIHKYISHLHHLQFKV